MARTGATRRELQRTLDAAIDDDVIGAFVTVARGAAAWTLTAGSAVVGAQIPVDPRSYIRIGSITKTFVATVVLQLVEEGTLHLDDPMQRHMLDAVPADFPPVTVRQLLQHCTGIPNFTPHVMNSAEQIVKDRDRAWAVDELLGIAFARPMEFEPGAEMRYSNSNYLLLGLLIEAVTGTSWGEGVRQRIVEPLGLTSTYAPGTDTALPEPHPHGYVTLERGGVPEVVDISDVSMTSNDAAGSMISTVGDVEHFFDALLTGHLLAPSVVDTMLQPGPGSLVDIPGIGWGLGILTMELPSECGGSTVYGGAGGTFGYTCLEVGTRDRVRRVAVNLNTAGPAFHPPRTDKLVTIAQLALC